MNLSSRHVPRDSLATTPFAWVVSLWWLTIRRRWRHHGGAVLIAAVTAAALVTGARAAPAGGEPLYLSIILSIGVVAIVASPLILSEESVVSARRLDLLPIARPVRWMARLGLSNSLRSTLSIVVVAWGAGALVIVGPDGLSGASRLLQLAGITLGALAFSQLLEDVVRGMRAVVIHQIIFIATISFWPLAIEYLRDPGNFVPAPAWTTGPLSAMLVFAPAPAPVLPLLAATLLPWMLAGLFFGIDVWFVSRYEMRPPAAPASARWTAIIASTLSGRPASASDLGRELLIPLRFLFLRMTVIFVLLTAIGAFLTGVPLLLLSIPFWWQPLSTNALGPDYPDGMLRYSLIGMPISRVLRTRVVAAVVLSAAGVAAVAAVAFLAGWIEVPRVGPAHRGAYLFAFVYSLSLIPFWAIPGDYYSLSFPDRLEMHTLLPERTRSAGAAAVVILFLMWIGVIVAALAILALAAGFILLAFGLPPDAGRLAGILTLAAIGNTAAYFFHLQRLASRVR